MKRFEPPAIAQVPQVNASHAKLTRRISENEQLLLAVSEDSPRRAALLQQLAKDRKQLVAVADAIEQQKTAQTTDALEQLGTQLKRKERELKELEARLTLKEADLAERESALANPPLIQVETPVAPPRSEAELTALAGGVPHASDRLDISSVL